MHHRITLRSAYASNAIAEQIGDPEYRRLLGPCFKTGRLKPLCQHPKHVHGRTAARGMLRSSRTMVLLDEARINIPTRAFTTSQEGYLGLAGPCRQVDVSVIDEICQGSAGGAGMSVRDNQRCNSNKKTSNWALASTLIYTSRQQYSGRAAALRTLQLRL